MTTTRTPCARLAALAVTLGLGLGGCAGGGRDSDARDFVDGSLGAELGQPGLFDSDAAADCAVDVLSGSGISDDGLASLAAGRTVSSADGEAFSRVRGQLLGCG